VESLAQKDNVKELEHGVRDYQEKWHAIGPVVREEWEAIRDRFSTATRTIYDKIHEHYRARRTEHEANLSAKQALVDKVKALTERTAQCRPPRSGSTSPIRCSSTAECVEEQVGFATKKDNERIWKEFRNACNVLLRCQEEHFDKLKDQYKEVRANASKRSAGGSADPEGQHRMAAVLPTSLKTAATAVERGG
jgi:hypothetical protein